LIVLIIDVRNIRPALLFAGFVIGLERNLPRLSARQF
jgi:hypothetical protein